MKDYKLVYGSCSTKTFSNSVTDELDRLKAINKELLNVCITAREVLAALLDQPSPTVVELDAVIAKAKEK
jgi:hypothetical protein